MRGSYQSSRYHKSKHLMLQCESYCLGFLSGTTGTFCFGTGVMMGIVVRLVEVGVGDVRALGCW